MPARVDLELPTCANPSFDVESFGKLLRIELQTDGVRELRVRRGAAKVESPTGSTAPPDPALAVLTVEQACAADGTLALTIDDLATNKQVRRLVDLGPIAAPGRARVLALAAAELLRASWAELVLPDAPPARVVVPPAVKALATARMQRASARADGRESAEVPSSEQLFVIATPEARFFVRERLGLAGVRLGPSVPLGRGAPLRLRLHAGTIYGRGTVPEGRFDAWLLSAGAGVMASRAWHAAALEFGPHFELGWGWRRLLEPERAVASGGTSGDGVVGAVSIVGSGRVHLGGAWWSIADVELGQAASSEGGIVSTGSTTVGARLGVALSP